ncbi:MAG: 50S ribosomal protein L5 [Candidatus Altiarchaeota archaeon]|nr:50S ribosomal protein L5 [Candidatus Altiarchaeota archaeon]
MKKGITQTKVSKVAKTNVMLEPAIQKLTLNIGVGEGGEKLEKAVTLLKKITESGILKTRTMKRIPAFGVRPKLLVGAKVTVRGKKAEEILEKMLTAVGKQLKASKFDSRGNFSFGISDYGDIPGLRYDPHLGMFGMDVCVSMGRKGYRVNTRRTKAAKVGNRHLLTKEASIKFITQKFGIKVEEKVKAE